MAGMSCVCSPDTLQATCSLPTERSTAELLLATLLLLTGMLARRVEQCCVGGDGESEGDASGDDDGAGSMYT